MAIRRKGKESKINEYLKFTVYEAEPLMSNALLSQCWLNTHCAYLSADNYTMWICMSCDSCADAHSDLSSWPKGIHFKESQTFAGTKLKLKLNRWLPINLVCNIQQTTQETWDSQDTYTLTHTHTCMHSYVYEERWQLRANCIYFLYSVFIVVVRFLAMKLHRHRHRQHRHPHRRTLWQSWSTWNAPPRTYRRCWPSLYCCTAALSQTPLPTRPDQMSHSATHQLSRVEPSLVQPQSVTN